MELNGDQTRTGKPNMDMREKPRARKAQWGEKHRTRGHRTDIYSPLPEGTSRALQHLTGRGADASRDRDPGRKASRAAPAPGPTVEQGTREAMADLPLRPQPQPPPRPLQLEPYYPHKKNSLGEIMDAETLCGPDAGTGWRSGGVGI